MHKVKVDAQPDILALMQITLNKRIFRFRRDSIYPLQNVGAE